MQIPMNYLKIFTFLGQQEIADLAAQSEAHPEQRAAQKCLAQCVTELVHGADALDSARRISDCLFGGDVDTLQQQDLAQLQQDGMQTSQAEPGQGLLNVMVAVGAAKSIGEARKLVQGAGVRLNGEVVQDPRLELDFSQALFGQYFVLRRGKKAYHLITKSI